MQKGIQPRSCSSHPNCTRTHSLCKPNHFLFAQGLLIIIPPSEIVVSNLDAFNRIALCSQYIQLRMQAELTIHLVVL